MNQYEEDAKRGVFSLKLTFDASIGKLAIEGAVANNLMALGILEMAKREYEMQYNLERMGQIQADAMARAHAQQLVSRIKL